MVCKIACVGCILVYTAETDRMEEWLQIVGGGGGHLDKLGILSNYWPTQVHQPQEGGMKPETKPLAQPGIWFKFNWKHYF